MLYQNVPVIREKIERFGGVFWGGKFKVDCSISFDL